jgi:hypothetical protein
MGLHNPKARTQLPRSASANNTAAPTHMRSRWLLLAWKARQAQWCKEMI